VGARALLSKGMETIKTIGGVQFKVVDNDSKWASFYCAVLAGIVKRRGRLGFETIHALKNKLAGALVEEKENPTQKWPQAPGMYTYSEPMLKQIQNEDVAPVDAAVMQNMALYLLKNMGLRLVVFHPSQRDPQRDGVFRSVDGNVVKTTDAKKDLYLFCTSEGKYWAMAVQDDYRGKPLSPNIEEPPPPFSLHPFRLYVL
jgi:hypothetical protein